MGLFLGIDFGTSGARAIAIDSAEQVVAETSLRFGALVPSQRSQGWRAALFEVLGALPLAVRSQLLGIAINGTSGTVMLCDRRGIPLIPPLMYHETGGPTAFNLLKTIAPPGHPVLSASSSLVKLLHWAGQMDLKAAHYFMHQADWLASQLHGQLGISDYHNSLKLGYDPAQAAYPNWFQGPVLTPLHPLLPSVVAPGQRIGPIQSAVAKPLAIHPACQIHAGTTDSIAAFLASGARQPGAAVTSLGSTLVLKLLSRQRIDAARYGIYSHRLGPLWLVGGASNTGGAVLQDYFTAAELETLSQKMDPNQASPYDYYPLRQAGERFPINDPDLQPRLTPRPDPPEVFLQGLLESMARIEAQGYQRLEELGATPVTEIYTAGGGAKNPAWTAIRQRCLQKPLRPAIHPQAAYGTACLVKAAIAKDSAQN